MALVEMLMPKMGESIMEGTILNWLKKVGDKIEQDESVLEVATDKVDTEVPATHAGILKEILAEKGTVVQVGKPIAIISTDGDTNDSSVGTSHITKSNNPVPETSYNKAVIHETVNNNIHHEVKSSGGRFYSPLVLNIARQEGVSMSELERVNGTGKEGRVTKNDIIAFVEQKKKTPEVKREQPVNGQIHTEEKIESVTPAKSYSGNYEIIEMDRMRKMIAERMKESKRISPHVTSFVEADVTNIVYWRNKYKNDFMDKEGAALTFTPIFIEAVVKAIKDYP